MLIYHASKQIVELPEIRKTKFTKAFSWGFYCTNDFRQTVRWANRGEGTPYVNHYEFTDSGSLKILKFERMTDEWLDFIAASRNGGTHQYDVVEGPMADDTVWNFVNDFLTGRINRKQFWALAEFKYPTQQISFHTLSALACLKFLKFEVKHDGSR